MRSSLDILSISNSAGEVHEIFKCPLVRIEQILKYTMCTCCGKPAMLFIPMLLDIERELFSMKKTE